MSNPTQPTHEAIALRAHQLWKEHGSPHGNDLELWFEAERQLTAGAAAAADEHHGHAAPVHANPAAPAHGGPATSAPDMAQAQADRQKQDARAPQLPHHTGAAAKPPVSGKPIFPKPHSS